MLLDAGLAAVAPALCCLTALNLQVQRRCCCWHAECCGRRGNQAALHCVQQLDPHVKARCGLDAGAHLAAPALASLVADLPLPFALQGCSGLLAPVLPCPNLLFSLPRFQGCSTLTDAGLQKMGCLTSLASLNLSECPGEWRPAGGWTVQAGCTRHPL